ncbi:MAG: hypothetical protein IPI49_10130 [Myxococcales bacterium]|jgi:hypothetical protein|nr:hypothetical protein [Myxococcales bacterium]
MTTPLFSPTSRQASRPQLTPLSCHASGTRPRRGAGCLALLLAACTAGSPPPEQTAGTVSGVIEYRGQESGPLRVAVFSSFPPRGAPVAEVVIEDPVFPQAYAVHGVPPGRYFLLALVDTNVDDGDRYRPRVDPGGTYGAYRSPASITVETSGSASGIDLGLVAPAPGSPWDR